MESIPGLLKSLKIPAQHVPGTLLGSGRALQVGVGPDLLGHLQALFVADWGLLQLTQLLNVHTFNIKAMP